MKELSIKEKAKRYDEVIERVVNIKTGKCETTFIFTEGLFDYLFPELEECNEEEVRKAMIDFFKHEREEGVVVSHYGVNIERMIAWLEKQKTSEEAIQYLKENHSPSEVSDFQAAMNIAVAKAYDKGVKDGLEKQSEQKPADKVEPKFQNGQWIVWQGKYYKVNDNGCGYELVDQNGLNTSLEYGTVDESAHVWDITKDAKDGDVLADNVGVILFKGIGDNNVINFHAYFSGLFAVQEGEHYWGHIRECTLSPAAKEQRERFFAAMHDAGYEWDAEKKELKKISQRMISAEAKEAMYGKPTAWSEEDSIRLQRIIDFLWYNRKGDTDTIYQQEQDIDWLKSLKDRVHPQPKQGWSEADNMRSTSTMQVLEYAKSIPDYNQFGIDDINKNIDWLKSLRPQPKQEWSKEDKKMSRFIGNAITADDSSVYLKNKGIEVIDAHVWLNELKYRVQPQNQWKPSDEQMEVLKALVEDNNQRYFYTTLNSLYEQLKKLKA